MYGVSDLFTGVWHLIKDPFSPPTSKELNDRLHAAVWSNQTQPALYALKKGAQPTNRHLEQAVIYQNMKLIKPLIDHGCDINACTSSMGSVGNSYVLEASPLFAAVESGSTKTVKLLLENGANVYGALITNCSGAGTGANQTTSPMILKCAESENLRDIVAILKEHIAQNPPPAPPLSSPAQSGNNIATPAAADFNKDSAPKKNTAPSIETGKKITVKRIKLKNAP